MNKQKIIMLRGISGSGKSTWRKQAVKENYRTLSYVNKDEIREILHGGLWSKENEKEVIAEQDRQVIELLREGMSVIIDNTHLYGKWEPHFRDIAEEYDVEFEVKHFDIDVEEAIRRDELRENPVGEKVIRRMDKQIKKFKYADPIVYDPDLEMVIISDLDGTIALINNRSPFDGQACRNDLPNLPVIDLINMYWNHTDDRIIIFSGRNDNSWDQTVDWLAENGVLYDELHMRPDGDFRKDSIIKEEMYREFVEGKYNVRFVLDDRDQTTAKYRELGLQCFQVAEGDF